MDWANQENRPVEYKPLDDGIRIGKAVVFNVIALCGVEVSIVIGLLGVGITSGYPPVQFFSIIVSIIMIPTLIVAFLSEWGKQETLFDIHIKKHKPKESPTITEIHNHHSTPGGVKTTINQYETDKLPPKEFIEWLFKSATPDGRIPSERAIRESEWSQSAFNDWLDVLDKESITVKVDSRSNAARKIQGTLEDALKHFNYEIKEQLK